MDPLTESNHSDTHRHPITPENRRPRHLFFVLALISTALFGAFLLLRATPFGLGLVNDTSAYVNGAANLLAGNGYTRTSGGGELKPITHFPPFFSIVLASFRFTGLDFVEIGHILILFFFALTIVLSGWLIYSLTHSTLLALFSAFLIACSDTILGVYASLMSEPLFIVLMLGAVLSFGQYYSQRKIRWMVVTGVMLGLAYLTRFAGLSLLAAFLAALVLLARPRSFLRASFWQPVGALLLGAAPFLLSWSVYNWWISGEVGNRTLIVHPIPSEKLFDGLKNLLTWLAPQEILAIHPIFGWGLSALSLITPIALLGLLAWIWVSSPHSVSPTLAAVSVLALHILGYLAFLVASISLFDASTPLDDRILTIIYIPEMILFAMLIWFILRRVKEDLQSSLPAPFRKRLWSRQAVVILFCLVLVGFSMRDGLAAVQTLSRDGLGFNHSGWRNSAVIAQVREMPPLILYSNRPTAIYLLTGKSAYVVPTPIDAVTTLERPNFDADLVEMRNRVLHGQAALVLFDMKTDPETANLYRLMTDSLPLVVDLGREQIFAVLP